MGGKDADGVKGEPVKVSGDLFYPRYTALVAGRSAKAYFAGRMRRLSVKLR